LGQAGRLPGVPRLHAKAMILYGDMWSI
jgi:hypothetical protein